MPYDAYQDRRLHPWSVLFGVFAQVKQFALPALAFIVTAGSTGFGWQGWLLIPVALSTLVSIARYLTFRYRYEPDHIVITDGLLFRNVRHIPYARIQNIDAVQTVVHRLVGVAEVRIETGGGSEPEAKLDVLPVAAFAEMRARVFGVVTSPVATSDVAGAGSERPLLSLDARELVLFGLINNRGMIVVGAIFGLLWEIGLMDRLIEMVVGPNVSGRGLLRTLLRSAVGLGQATLAQFALALMAFTAFVALVRAFSIGWAFVRLYGFTLVRSGNDLRMSFGLLTHVTATIPIHRIQKVTIHENPVHRWLERASVRVETAGSKTGTTEAPQREWLAPLIRRSQLPMLLENILPGVNLSAMDWQPPGARAFRREMVGHVVMALLAMAFGTLPFGVWSIVLLPLVIAWGTVVARKYVEHLRWAVSDGTVAFRSGWLLRQLTVIRFAKIQVVTLDESPFDRRHGMASVRVDTAGASSLLARVNIPYIPRDRAGALRAQLARSAERNAFEW